MFEAKFMLPWTFSEEAAAEKHVAQLQHNMWVVQARSAALSIITGGGKWVEVVVHADPLYQHLLLTAERKFWRCVQNGEEPRLFGVEPPRPRLEAVRSVDMSGSNFFRICNLGLRLGERRREGAYPIAGAPHGRPPQQSLQS